MRRRDFLATTAIGGAALTFPGKLMPAETPEEKRERSISIFTKCLQFLDYDELGEVLAETGFKNADLTVRRGGQVLPETVNTDLATIVKSLRKSGVGVQMITTGITDPDDPATEKILQAASEQEIGYYRMGAFPYDQNKPVPQNLEELRGIFIRFEKLNRRYRIRGEYQNHSGRDVGGPVWDLYHLLKDIDPQYIGVQYDVRHATVEGGLSWLAGMRLLTPWIGTTDLKDFLWVKDERGRWRPGNVPLGEGMVDFDTYFREFKKLENKAPVCIHYEYDLGGAEHGSKTPTMPLDEIKRWLKKDLTWLKDQFEKYQIV